METAEPKQYFWRGEIRTRRHAQAMITWVAVTYLVLGGLCGLLAISRGHLDVSMFIVAALMFIPAGFLLQSKGLGAARTLMGVAGAMLAITVVASVAMLGLQGGVLMLLPSLVIFSFLFALTMRSARAAKWLRDERVNAPDLKAQVFD